MVKFSKSGVVGFCAEWTMGIWWIRAGRYLLTVKASWNAALFSERNGAYLARIPIWRGWRVILRQDERGDHL